jgi:hypothetical protein
MKSFIVIAVSSLIAVGSAFAGPFDQGMVGGQLKSNVRVGTINQNNKATLGYAKQELNVGSVVGGKALGNVELNVRAKDITQTNKATLGYAEQSANIGTLK